MTPPGPEVVEVVEAAARSFPVNHPVVGGVGGGGGTGGGVALVGGIGGGAANIAWSSGTLCAAAQPAMPCAQTRVCPVTCPF